ncbi:hypothetical protein ACVIW0_006248 [Bradyrhizobium sp. USDA 4454]
MLIIEVFDGMEVDPTAVSPLEYLTMRQSDALVGSRVP